MQTYVVDLASAPSTSFYCQKAANALDIDTTEKLSHHLEVEADVETPYSVGLIVGASGSGKTTLAHQMWGKRCFRKMLDPKRPVMDQFPEEMSYDERSARLNGVGLAQVVCWIRPAHTLSNGQRERAEIALQLAHPPKRNAPLVIDEWTSVVDRTVAKVMSYCVGKHARRADASIVLLSCHYDVIEWLDPDWIIDCNKQRYTNRRRLRRGQRRERIDFEIAECDRRTWAFFSRYHYLSHTLPGGLIRNYGLFHGDEQVGFLCFANYTPKRPGQRVKMHANRLVIHPDYQGFGLGMLLINGAAKALQDEGFEIWSKFSSMPVFKAMSRDPHWSLEKRARVLKQYVGSIERNTGYRRKVTTFSFRYVADPPAESSSSQASASSRSAA